MRPTIKKELHSTNNQCAYSPEATIMCLLGELTRQRLRVYSKNLTYKSDYTLKGAFFDI